MPRGAVTALVVLVLAVAVAAGITVGAGSSLAHPVRCDLGDPARASGVDVAGYGGEQLLNAAIIIDTATGMGLDSRAQLLGVMAAMGESGLRVLPYGDYETSGVLNPDGTPTTSIGLFQQQDWWGSTEQRLDPAESATLFFDRLKQVDGWEFLPDSEAIHRVQQNTDPDHYTTWRTDAEAVVAALRVSCVQPAG